MAAADKLLEKCLSQAPDDTVAQVYRVRCERFLKTGLHEGSGEFDLVIEWDSSLAIDHAEIDAQHRGLFDGMQRFAEALQKSRDWKQIHALIDYLNEHAVVHFETEEGYMAEKNYPFLPLQKSEHRRFANYCKGFKDEIERDRSADRIFLLFRVQVFLIDWLLNHISKLDGHFGKYLRHSENTG